jgi:hypothetical protein
VIQEVASKITHSAHKVGHTITHCDETRSRKDDVWYGALELGDGDAAGEEFERFFVIGCRTNDSCQKAAQTQSRYSFSHLKMVTLHKMPINCWMRPTQYAKMVSGITGPNLVLFITAG